MTVPLAGDRTFRNDPVRLADLTVNTVRIEGYEFTNCRILGPAVVMLQDCTVAACSFDAPGLDAFFWEVPPTRPLVVGAIAIIRCIFSNCRFEGIGIAGPPELRAIIEASFR